MLILCLLGKKRHLLLAFQLHRVVRQLRGVIFAMRAAYPKEIKSPVCLKPVYHYPTLQQQLL